MYLTPGPPGSSEPSYSPSSHALHKQYNKNQRHQMRCKRNSEIDDNQGGCEVAATALLMRFAH
jgi:hypothetical protein